ncbi:hypothetical protein HBA54_21705 [Pelagibius litoralis]|uniref:Uncharacterized protein n=1 Tax=Pelagibius litoralis TaxID=374515 RepID=A0A967KFB7_9PROT|nr:hypothetical protein [Pelagibius litoralis]NIA71220.1 hypothetical protein [Pelagibius litoralis]
MPSILLCFWDRMRPQRSAGAVISSMESFRCRSRLWQAFPIVAAETLVTGAVDFSTGEINQGVTFTMFIAAINAIKQNLINQGRENVSQLDEKD